MSKVEIAILQLSGVFYCDPEIILETIKENKELLAQFKSHLKGEIELDQVTDTLGSYL